MRSWHDYMMVAVCVATAVLLARAGSVVRRDRMAGQTRDTHIIWWLLAAVFCLFAIVKGVNLLTVVGVWLRETAKAEGIYPERKAIQYLFMGFLGVGTLIAAASLIAYRSLARRHWLILCCTGAMAVFGAMRFVSLHAIDHWMRTYPAVRVLAELLLSGTVCVVAWRRLNRPRA